MKVEITEYEKVISIDMTAETVADAALLARIGLNATNQLEDKWVDASRTGEFTGSLSLRKRSRESGLIKSP